VETFLPHLSLNGHGGRGEKGEIQLPVDQKKEREGIDQGQVSHLPGMNTKK